MATLVTPFSEPDEGEELGKLWHHRIERSIKWRERKWNADKQWARNLKLDRGLHWEQDFKNIDASSENPRERITVNITKSFVRDFLAFLFKYDPRFICKPRREDSVKSAKMQEEILNYFWREKDWKKQARRAVRDMITFGTGVIRTGWVTELDAAASPDEHGELNVDDAIRKDEPVVKRVPLAKFIVDPDAPGHDLATSRWCAEVVHVPLTDVLANTKYLPEVMQKIKDGALKPTMITREALDKAQGQQLSLFTEDQLLCEEDEASSIVRMFDVWDKKYKRHLLLLEGVDEPIFQEEWPYEHLDGFPYVMGLFDEMNDEWYGVGLPHDMEDQQFELNRIRTASFQHRRNFGRRRLQILRGAIDPTEQAKLQKGTDADIVVNAPNAISPIEYPSLPADGERVEQSIMADIRTMIGADQIAGGGNLPSRTSAAEINARNSYTGLKIDMRVGAVDCFITDVSRQILQHMKEYLDLPTAIRIEGPTGAEWAMVTKDDIQGETDLEITTVSAERTDQNMERQQAMTMVQNLQQAAPMLMQMGAQVDWVGLYRWVFRDKFGVREFDSFVHGAPPMPPPGAPGVPQGEDPGVPGVPMSQVSAQQQSVQPQSAPMGGLLGGG